MTTTPNPRSTRVRAAALTAALGLTLAACGTSPEDQADEATDTATGVATDTSGGGSAAGASDDASDDASEDAGVGAAGGGTDVAFDAIATATGELAGSQAYELDTDADGDDDYEIDVTDGTTSTEVSVSADGSEVLATEQGELDDDVATVLSSLEIDMPGAIRAALAEQAGTVEEVDLDDDGGTLHWAVEIRDDAGTEHDLRIDAQTGAVL